MQVIEENPFDDCGAYEQVPPYDKLTGFKSQTTFWADFVVAEIDGAKGIRDTFERAKPFLDDVQYGIELTMTLNWRGWLHYQSHHESEIAKLYFALYEQHHAWCLAHYKGADLSRYLKEID